MTTRITAAVPRNSNPRAGGKKRTGDEKQQNRAGQVSRATDDDIDRRLAPHRNSASIGTYNSS